MRFQGLVFVAMLCGTTVGTLAKADSRLTISDDLPGATLDVGKPRISSHASVVPSVKVIGGVVLEAMNAGKFLSEKHLEAQCRTRLSNASDQDVALRLAFTFRLPDQTGIDRVAMRGEPVVVEFNSPANSTQIIDLPIHMSKSLWDLLKTRAGRYATSTIEFDIALPADSAGQLKITSQDGHIPFSVFEEAPMPPKSGIYRDGDRSLIEIDGEPQYGNFCYIGWNWGVDPETVRMFAKSGRHVYRIVFQPWSLWEGDKLDSDKFETRMNEIVTSVVGRDPQAKIAIHWWLHGPKDWGKYHPDEIIVYDDGSTNCPNPQPLQNGWQHASYSSKVWKAEQTRIISEAVRRLENSPYADRVFSVSLGYGNAGEWNNFGYHGGKFADYSAPEREVFANWCRTRYREIDNLNHAWSATLSDWADIRIPSRAQRLEEGWHSFAGPKASVDVRDYHRFKSEQTVDLIDEFANIVKRESNNKLLVGVYYGYFTTHLTGAPVHALDSGHYALAKLLKSPAVDFIISPYNYGNRKRNIGLGNPIQSVMAAGKAYVVELDLPTHRFLANSPLNAAAALPQHGNFSKTPEESIRYYWRDIARVAAWGVNAHWYDFSKAWYDFPEFTEFVNRVQSLQLQLASRRAEDLAKVAVLVDEESAFFLGANSRAYGGCLYETLADEMDETGAPWDLYLASDIDKVVKKKYRLIIVINQIKDASVLREKLRGSGATVVWGYGAGLFEKGRWSDRPDGAGAVMRVMVNQPVGAIALGKEMIPPPTSLKSWAGTPSHNLSEVKPRITIDDPTVIAWAKFEDGSTAVGYRGTENPREFWVMTPQLSRRILGPIYKSAGIHRYSQDGSSVYVNGSLVALWKAGGGDSVLGFPRKVGRLRDAWTGKVVATDIDSFKVKGKAGMPTLGVYFIETP